MGTLYAVNDKQDTDRRNREAIIGRLRLPLYDVNDTDVVTLAAKPVDGVLLGLASTPLYTVPAIAVTHLHSITLLNNSASPVQAFVNIVPSGGAVGVATRIFNDVIQPTERVEIVIPFFLATGDFIAAHAATDAVVSAHLNLLDYTNQPTALNLKVIQGVALPSTNTTIYTVPGSGVKHAILLAAVFCNTTTNPHTVFFYKTPSGQASGQSRYCAACPTLTSRETLFDEPNHILEPGDFLEGRATSASLVAARLTVLEVV